MKVSQGAAPDGTLQAVMVVFVLAAIIILPSLGLLYVLDQKGLLPGEGVGVVAGSSRLTEFARADRPRQAGGSPAPGAHGVHSLSGGV